MHLLSASVSEECFQEEKQKYESTCWTEMWKEVAMALEQLNISDSDMA